jgi:hypothetical protein
MADPFRSFRWSTPSRIISRHFNSFRVPSPISPTDFLNQRSEQSLYSTGVTQISVPM